MKQQKEFNDLITKGLSLREVAKKMKITYYLAQKLYQKRKPSEMTILIHNRTITAHNQEILLRLIPACLLDGSLDEIEDPKNHVIELINKGMNLPSCCQIRIAPDEWIDFDYDQMHGPRENQIKHFNEEIKLSDFCNTLVFSFNSRPVSAESKKIFMAVFKECEPNNTLNNGFGSLDSDPAFKEELVAYYKTISKLEEAIKMAKEIMQKTMSFIPSFFMTDENDKESMTTTPYTNDEEKEQVLLNLKVLFAREIIKSYIYVVTCSHSKEAYNGKVRPSQASDAQQALLAVNVTDDKTTGIMIDFKEIPGGYEWGERITMENFKGRFTELLMPKEMRAHAKTIKNWKQMADKEIKNYGMKIVSK